MSNTKSMSSNKLTKLAFYLLLTFMAQTAFSATQSGLYNLAIPDEGYISDSNFAPGNLIVKPQNAFLFAKLSDMAYQTNLNAEDHNYIEDNGFQTVQGNDASYFYTFGSLKFLPLIKDITIGGNSKKLVILSFRGTDSTVDAINDLSYAPVPFYDNPDLQVHGGFHNQYFKRLRENEANVSLSGTALSTLVSNSVGTNNTYFVLAGHSLGGATATLYAASLRERGIPRENVLVYTYGAPPVGFDDFHNRYQMGGAEKPTNVLASNNQLDPVVNIHHLELPVNVEYNSLLPWATTYSWSHLSHIGLNLFPFDKNGETKTHKGCFPIGYFSPDLIDIAGRDLIDCRLTGLDPNAWGESVSVPDHKLGTYISNILNTVDLQAIANRLVADGQAAINFTPSELLAVEMVVTAPKYSQAITGKSFDSSRLSTPLRKELLQELRRTGVPMASSSFGALGEQINLSIKDSVNKRQVELNSAKNTIDSTQALGLDSYTELAYGTAINTVSAVADVLSSGASSASKIVLKTPVISAKLTAVASHLSKATPLMAKAIKLSQTKTFEFLKILIEADFAINAQLRGIIDTDAATAEMLGSVIGAVGQLSNAAITDRIKNKKAKLAVLFVGKLNDIVTAMLKGSTKAIILDQNLKTALHEFYVAVGELTPFIGPYYAQWNLGKKVSDSNANSTEHKAAWATINGLYAEIQAETQYVGELGFIKKLDIIVTSALNQIQTQAEISAARAAQQQAEEDERQAVYDTHIDSLLKLGTSTTGQEYVVNFDKNAEYYTLLMDSIQYGSPVRLKYVVGNIGDGQFLNVDATYNAQKGGFVFTAPTTEAISFYEVVVPLAPIDEGGLPRTYYHYDAYTDEIAIQTVAEEYVAPDPSTCPAGATPIACEVGLHVAGSVDTLSYANDVTISGNYAYVADGYSGLQVIDISNPTLPVIAGSVGTPDYARGATISGNYAYVADGYSGLQVIDISNPTLPVIAGSVNTLGYAYGVTISGNYAYVVDRNSGLQVIDISDPTLPVIAGSVATPGGYAYGVTISGNYAYVADGDSGLQVIDISNPALPVIAGSVGTPGNAYGVTINGNYAYVAGYHSGLHVIDISSPTLPVIAGSVVTPGNASGVTISGNYAYVADYNSGLQVIDISNPTLPVIAGSVNTPDFAYGVTVSGNYAYVAVDNSGLQVIDISSPTLPVIAGSVNTPGYAYSVTISGNYAYVADRNSGLQVIDISDPTLPVIAGSVNTPGYANGVTISGNYAYVADGGSGVQVIDISNPTLPVIAGSVNTPDFAYGVTVSGNYAYVADKNSGLQVIDISSPTLPVIAGSVNTPDFAYGVTVSGNYAYVADYNSGLQVIDISSPTLPVIAGSVNTPGYAYSVTISGNYAYVADGYSGLQVIDISNPTLPVIAGSVNTLGYAYGVTVSGNYAYVADGGSGVQVIDISNPALPVIAGSVGTPDYARGATISGNYAYVASSGAGLQIIDLQKGFDNYQAIQAYYHPKTTLSLLSETPQDYELIKTAFTKSWTFSEDISSFDVSVISNSYGNSISAGSFTKAGSTLSVDLIPEFALAENKLELSFSNAGKAVTINGSPTFWSVTNTNSAPQLVAGQVMQMTSTTSGVASLTIDTFDADGDTVYLSVYDADGGNVFFNGNTLSASFSDTLAVHTIKIRLNDGIKTIIKSIDVLRFDAGSIRNFYSDVNPDATAYSFDAIAFATLKGVVGGQADPNNAQQRIFRPSDRVSMAEALAMVVNAGVKAGLIQLPEETSYLQTSPRWAMPYYTYAYQHNALDIDGHGLADFYPNREEIAKLIVKVLELDVMMVDFPNLDVSFTDSATFSDAAMVSYGNIAHFLGLFMTESAARAQDDVYRVELAQVIKEIFRMPSAELAASSGSIEQGDSVSLVLNNLKAQDINSSYVLIDSSATVSQTYFNYAGNLTLPLDSASLKVGVNRFYVLLSQDTVKSVTFTDVDITFTDSDGDGLQDRYDVSPLNPNESLDSDADGIADGSDNCPNISNTGQEDLDGDGRGNLCDLDSDNDGIPDSNEIALGLDPLNPSDAAGDIDGDGVTNVQEYQAGTDPTDINSAPSVLGFSLAAYTVNETDGTIAIPVTRTGSSTGIASVTCQTSDGTAESGTDYASANTTLNWTDGDSTTQYCHVTLLADQVAEQDQAFTVTLTNTSNGAIVGQLSATEITITESSETILGDLGGDRKADILLYSSNLEQLFAFEMDGASIINTKGIAKIPSWSVLSKSGDYNGDGKADILLRNSTSHALVIFLMDGTTISKSKGIAKIPGWSLSGVADFNADGKSDILLQNDVNGTIVMFQMNGTVISDSQGIAKVPDWTVAATQDHNGDGKADILLYGPTNHKLHLYTMNGTSITASNGVAGIGAWTVSNVSDYTADSKADILLYHPTLNKLHLYTMNGSTISASTAADRLVGYTLEGHADLDGDNKTDLLVRDTDNKLHAWIKDGASTTDSGILSPVNGWSIADLADYDGDGDNDVLLQHDTNDILHMLRTDGVTVIQSKPVGRPTGWRALD